MVFKLFLNIHQCVLSTNSSPINRQILDTWQTSIRCLNWFTNRLWNLGWTNVDSKIASVMKRHELTIRRHLLVITIDCLSSKLIVKSGRLLGCHMSTISPTSSWLNVFRVEVLFVYDQLSAMWWIIWSQNLYNSDDEKNFKRSIITVDDWSPWWQKILSQKSSAPWDRYFCHLIFLKKLK